MATLVAVALFLLNGHKIASAALQNVAALRLLAPWQEALVDPSDQSVLRFLVRRGYPSPPDGAEEGEGLTTGCWRCRFATLSRNRFGRGRHQRDLKLDPVPQHF